MKILIYHNTTDSDLKTGLQVCYKDINGAFTNLGVITEILTDKDGIKNYLINTAMGAYMAGELKLIDTVKLTKKESAFFNKPRSMGEIMNDLFKGDSWAANQFQNDMLASNQLALNNKMMFVKP